MASWALLPVADADDDEAPGRARSSRSLSLPLLCCCAAAPPSSSRSRPEARPDRRRSLEEELLREALLRLMERKRGRVEHSKNRARSKQR